MSWSTRITRAPKRSGIARDETAQVLGLVVGKAGGRLVQQDNPRVAGDRARHFDQPPLACAQHSDLVVRHPVEPDERERLDDVRPAGRAVAGGVLVHHEHVVEDREPFDGLLGLERASKPPARAPEVGHRQNVLAEGANGARDGPDEAAEDVEERGLAGAVRPDQPTRAAGEADGHAVDRKHAAEADGQILDLDHAGDPLRPFDEPANRRPIARRSFATSLGTWSMSPPGAVSRTWSTPTPNRIVSSSGRDAPVVEQRRQQSQQERGDDRAPDAVDAAHQHDGEQEDRVLGRELVDVDAAGGAARRPPATPAMNDGERERPQLVAASCSRRRRARWAGSGGSRPRPGPACP